MREDMAKVIVERPRHKGSAWARPKGYKRQLARYGEDAPNREGIKFCWGNGKKWLNEHLGPLRRYLNSQVGRPWNKVFSEICAHIDRDSAVQDHVRDHIAEYVATNVILIDGIPCCGDGGRAYGRPLGEYRWRPWYVCPRTGILRKVKFAKRPPTEPPKVRIVHVSKTAQCRAVNGIWLWLTLRALPDAFHIYLCKDVDIFLRKPVTQLSASELRRTYGDEVYAVAIRRMTRKEIRQSPIPHEWWYLKQSAVGRRESNRTILLPVRSSL